MTESFVTPEDLAGYPGGPFTAPQIDRVVARIRKACGWHVAPERRETIFVDGDGGFEQWLPTRRVVEVHSVQIWDGWNWVDLPGWSTVTGWSESGILSSPRYPFPIGRRAIKVDLTHGFEVDADLKGFIAESTKRQVAAESIGARAVTYVTEDAFGAESGPLEPYRLGPRA